MTLDKVKTFFIAFGTAVSSWLGLLATPVYMLVGLEIIDYFTGLAAAPYREEARTSDKGRKGIIKKVCTLLLVVVGAIVDWIILYTVQQFGFESPFTFLIANLTSVWLMCNEILSILENIGDIGVKLPPLLMKAVEWVRKNTGDKGATK